jgi:hypothetical protein
MARRLILSLLALAAIASAAPKSATPASAPAVFVKADYIHSDYRCASCLKLERWSEAAITKGLADSLKIGRLTFTSESMDTPEGSALADRLGLTTKALVLMEMRNGKMTRFKELKDTWKNLRDSTAFVAYVKRETIAFLRSAR